jgi:hypothetical protein
MAGSEGKLLWKNFQPAIIFIQIIAGRLLARDVRRGLSHASKKTGASNGNKALLHAHLGYNTRKIIAQIQKEDPYGRFSISQTRQFA